jgi:hypothetical protein
MPERWELWESRVQRVMQNRSGRRDQDHFVIPHFIVWEAQGTDVSRVLSLTKICACLRVTVETYVATKSL